MRIIMVWALMMLLCAAAEAEPAARAELPGLKLAFEAMDEEDGEYTLRLSVQREHQVQEIIYHTWEDADASAAMVCLEDVNFDGYPDLVLPHALGSSNMFCIVAPWLPDEARFADPIEDIRLCNYTLHPEEACILSVEKDGAASYLFRSYVWTGGHLTLMDECVIEREADGNIHERAMSYFSDGAMPVVWDETYPAAWYMDARVWNERYDVLQEWMRYVHRARRYAKVVNVSWVHLRKQDSKASPSLAKLDEGTSVQVLREGCGEDGGWVRVYIAPETWEETGLTGYIWHSFLEDM